MIHRQSNLIKLSSIAIIMGGITAVLMVVNVVMSTRVSQDGLVIDTLSKQQEILKGQIHDLEQRLYAQTSLNDLSAKAEQLGYVLPTDTKTLPMIAPIAFNR